jgi:hypothetical protein
MRDRIRYTSAQYHFLPPSGPRKKINTQSCLSFGPSTALHPPAHIHKYALADAPCIRTKIRRNLAHLFFAETLSFLEQQAHCHRMLPSTYA